MATDTGTTGGLFVGIASLFTEASATFPEGPARDEYLWKRLNLLIEVTTKERQGMLDKATKMQLQQEKLKAEALSSIAKAKVALATNDSKGIIASVEAVQRDVANRRDNETLIEREAISNTATALQRAATAAKIDLTSANGSAEFWNKFAGGSLDLGTVSEFNMASPFAYDSAVQVGGNPYTDSELAKTIGAVGMAKIDKLKQNSEMAVMGKKKVFDDFKKTADQIIKYGAPKSAEEAKKFLKTLEDAQNEIKNEEPVNVQQATELMAAANTEYQENLKRIEELESTGTQPETVFTMRGKIVAKPEFRKWAHSRGFNIGTSRVDEHGNLLQYVKGEDDKRAIRVAARELKRHPRDEALVQKPTPLVAVEKRVDVPFNALKVSQFVDGYRYFNDPNTGKTWKQGEDRTITETQEVPETVVYKDAGVWDTKANAPKRLATADDIESNAAFGAGDEAIAELSDPKDVEKAKLGTPDATKVEDVYGKKEKMLPRDYLYGEPETRVTGASGTEKIPESQVAREEVVKEGRNPFISGERAERVAKRLAGKSGEEKPKNDKEEPLSAESEALASMLGDGKRRVVKDALERMRARQGHVPEWKFVPPTLEGLPEEPTVVLKPSTPIVEDGLADIDIKTRASDVVEERPKKEEDEDTARIEENIKNAKPKAVADNEPLAYIPGQPIKKWTPGWPGR